MLTISTTSWHYRLAKLGQDSWYSPPGSLCPYFWAVVRGMLVLSFFIVIGVLAAVSMADLAYALFHKVTEGKMVSYFYFGTYGDEKTFFPLFTIGIAILIVVAAISSVIGAWILHGVYQEKRREYYMSRLETPTKKEPNIFWEFLKAKHEKICPTLTFKRPEEKDDE